MLSDDPARAALAEHAAAGAQVLPQLRLLCLAEAISAPGPTRALDLNGELDVLCTALQESVRRRPGWLYFAPAGQAVPVALPRQLLQAAVLCWTHAVLAETGSRAVMHLDTTPAAAVLVLRGGTGRNLPADTRALRLPLHSGLPVRETPSPADLLYDRYSALQVFLPGYCTGANE